MISNSPQALSLNISFSTSDTALWSNPSNVSSFNLEFQDAMNSYLFNLNDYGDVVNVSTSLNASTDRPTIFVKFVLTFNNDVTNVEKILTLQE